MVVDLNVMEITVNCSSFPKPKQLHFSKRFKVNIVNAKCENAGFMFMFRRKRTYLLKRLWKARVKSEHEIWSKEVLLAGENDTSSSCTGPWCSSDEGMLRNSVFKRLKDNQLELLLEAVDSEGAGNSACVLVPKDIILEPHILCCQIWRWPSLSTSDELKRTPACSCASDPVYICCNPYHWSRLCEPESPPPPYSRFSSGKMSTDDRISNEKIVGEYDLENHHHHMHYHPCSNPFCQEVIFRESLSTSGESEKKETEWCKLAYWELSQRVGQLYPVQNTAVNIFWTDIQADGLNLEALTHHAFSTPESVNKNRNKIRLGITLSLEDDGVWIYNRSNWPVFVNSPSLDQPGCRNLSVYRVPAGHCFRVFYPGARITSSTCRHGPPIGPVDPNSVRISFAKGWGPKYHRQEITACPTWLEILLSPCR